MGVVYSMYYIFFSIRRYYIFYVIVLKIMFVKIIIVLDNYFIIDLFIIGIKWRYLKYSNLLLNVEFYIYYLVINVKFFIY